jgi:hypothetical protein
MYADPKAYKEEFGGDKLIPLESQYLMNFKVLMCQNQSHYVPGDLGTRADCFFFHSSQDRRRPPLSQDMVSLAYAKNMCPNVQKCANSHCPFAHNLYEQAYHPQNISNTLKNQMQAKISNDITASALGIPGLGGPSYPIHAPPGLTENMRNNGFGSLGKSWVLGCESTKQMNETRAPAPRGEVSGLSADSPWLEKNYFLAHFKVHKCNSTQTHDQKTCPMFHRSSDCRRNPFTDEACTSLAYHQELCPNVVPGSETGSNSDFCDDSCRYCHNNVEIMYHPDRFRKKFCKNHGDGSDSKCPYGFFCSFAHDRSQIIIEDFLDALPQDADFFRYKYKTVWCPYSSEHDKSKCVYAHNIQDFRRDPTENLYSPDPCPHWNLNGKSGNYREGNCHFRCKLAHNHKEQRFHPDYYKTKKCTNRTSCKQDPCPFYHFESERL